MTVRFRFMAGVIMIVRPVVPLVFAMMIFRGSVMRVVVIMLMGMIVGMGMGMPMFMIVFHVFVRMLMGVLMFVFMAMQMLMFVFSFHHQSSCKAGCRSLSIDSHINHRSLQFST